MPASTKAQVKARLKRGQKVRRIADALGISTQMVYAYRRDMINDGELDPRVKELTRAR